MKIAVCGKGGTGKSTTTALLVSHLLNKGKKALVVDADINMHISGLLGIDRNDKLALSDDSNAKSIREYLRGSNKRIKSVEHFVKTTLPGEGSHLINLREDDFVIKNFSSQFDDSGYYMFVGSYGNQDIGLSCYHTSLTIFENILSHSVLSKDEYLVADMVAGTDLFANSQYAQFDAIVLVVEPTPEGVSVFEQYVQLAKESEVLENLYVIGNKIEDETDIEYLKKKVGERFLGGFSQKKQIKQARQNDEVIDLSLLTAQELKFLSDLIERVDRRGENKQKKLRLMHELHEKHAKESWLLGSVGDVSDQLDPLFIDSRAKSKISR